MSFDVRGKQIAVLGLAREGLDLALFLCRRGAEVTVSDQKPAAQLSAAVETLRPYRVRYCLGGERTEAVLEAERLYVSPGVPQEHPLVVEARRRGIEVSSATQLLLELAPCPVVGITGSSGKTTTTSLVGAMFQADGRHTLVGGNIGVPLLCRLEEVDEHSWLVVELSSFQLETVSRSPSVAAVTNVTPNHLDRHPTMEDYTAAKARIFRFQGPDGWAILNAEDSGSAGYRPPGRVLRFALGERSLAGRDGAFLRDDRLVLRTDGEDRPICAVSEVILRGRHNLANLLTAFAVCSAAGVGVEAMRDVATTFRGVPHRLQVVAEKDGVTFVDDSIATSPERSIAALRAYQEPVVLIAGGRDKHLPMDEWAGVIVERARHVVLLGEMSDLIERAIRSIEPDFRRLERVESMDQAVAAAGRAAQPGDVVLLSPGGTSFDLYTDFAERGDDFARAARQLATGAAE